MTNQAIRRLTALTAMMQEARLAALSQAEAARRATLDAIAGLDRAPQDEDLDPVTHGLVQVGYARWADVRRRELGTALARQTAASEQARAAARTAYGRNQALLSVAAKLAQNTRTAEKPDF